MKNLIAAVLILFLFHLTASGYQAAVEAPAVDDERLQSMLWTQTSLEYKAACAQVYAAARSSLDIALCHPTHTAAIEQIGLPCACKPPAIILDVDETVLDNGPMQARLVATGTSFNREQWNEWCLAATAKTIQGVRPFLQYARSRGVTVFFVTNRDGELDKATAQNLTAELGYHVTPDMVLCKNERPEWTSDKSTRRAKIAASHRIVMLVGDQFGDFMHIEEASAEERITAGEPYLNKLGRSWILVPNPNYGDWEQALYDYNFKLDRSQIKRKKAAALRPWKT